MHLRFSELFIYFKIILHFVLNTENLKVNFIARLLRDLWLLITPELTIYLTSLKNRRLITNKPGRKVTGLVYFQKCYCSYQEVQNVIILKQVFMHQVLC